MSSDIPAEQSAGPSLRDRLLLGEALTFRTDDPDSHRTIEAEWIALAVASQVRVNLHSAIIAGNLQLRYAALENELTLAGCTFKGFADFSYATFKNTLLLSNSTFENGVTLHGITVEHDAQLERTEILAGLASFSDMHVKGVFWANWLSTGEGVQANFNRSRLEKTGYFQNSTFGGEASFRAVTFGDQATFQGATFKAKTSFNGTIIGHHALFRSEPEENIGGVKFEGPVDFGGARISGQALFQDTVFRKAAIFDEVRVDRGISCGGAPEKNQKPAIFEGTATFVGAVFVRVADFSGVVFKQKLDFRGCVVEGDASFQGDDRIRLPAAICEGEVTLIGARIGGSLDFRGVLFKKGANFSLATFDGATRFDRDAQREGQAAIFEGRADFVRTRFRGSADFRGTEFRGDVSFNLARLEAEAFFRHDPAHEYDGAVFGGAANFVLSHFGGAAEFQGVVFKQDVTFYGTRIEGLARFNKLQAVNSHAALFDGKADFSAAVISQLEMMEAKFSMDATFSGITVGEGALLTNTTFEGDADFTGAHFVRSASFQDAVFGKNAIFNVAKFDGDVFFSRAVFKAGEGVEDDFRGAHFDSVADFQGTIFEAPADFYAVHGKGLVRFEDGDFQQAASFREASFTALHFSQYGDAAPAQQFHADVDLIGCSYEHIQVDWQPLMAHARPYDRQPYTQLEKVLRAAGKDREADGVYLHRQHEERKFRYERREFGGWFFSVVYWLVANYGVRPYQLIGAAAVLLTAGSLYFSALGTVSAKERLTGLPGLVPVAAPVQLSKYEAFGVSLHQFLPVDVPLGSQWIPTEKPVKIILPGMVRELPAPFDVPSFFATFFLRLAGWILVPLGVAALTGLLRLKA